MSLQIAIAAAQAAAERTMIDACVVRRRSGEITDPFSGTVTATYETIYSGKCKVQQGEAQSRTEDAGQQLLVMKIRQLHLPVAGSSGIRRDDEVSLTSTTDPDLAGRVFGVRDIAGKTAASARRLVIQERA